jgi:hypothetical protein
MSNLESVQAQPTSELVYTAPSVQAPPAPVSSVQASSVQASSVQASSVHAEALYAQLKELVAKDGLSPLNISRVCVMLMQESEKYSELKGQEKKALILSVVQRYADEDSGNFSSVFIDMLPDLIDTFIAVDKHRLVIAKKEGKGCCIDICNIFTKNASKSTH